MRAPERYRSGHNGADSKSDGQGNLAQGFESLPLRHKYFRLAHSINITEALSGLTGASSILPIQQVAEQAPLFSVPPAATLSDRGSREDTRCQSGERQGLQPDCARAFQYGEE